MDITQTSLSPTRAHNPENERMMRAAAEQLEATFLAEMLKSAGLGETGGDFSGGHGEDQFSSLMVRAQADQIARAGGLGLAEMFFNAMVELETSHD